MQISHQNQETALGIERNERPQLKNLLFETRSPKDQTAVENHSGNESKHVPLDGLYLYNRNI